jgi:NNP family nitrate/nitrite transporter-like MFS transporter
LGLTGATLGFFVGFAAVSVFGPTATIFDQYMNLTSVQLGILVAMPNLSGSLLRIPFGAWADASGGRKPFLVLLGLAAVGMAGLLLLLTTVGVEALTVDTYPLLLLLAFLSGCGIATFSVGIAQVSYWFPVRRQGFALGAFAGLGNIAPGLFSYLVPLLIAGVGIGWTYGAWLGFLLVGIGIYTLAAPNAWFFQLRSKGVDDEDAREMAREHGQEFFPGGGVIETLISAAKNWPTWPLVGLYFTTFGGFLALTVWYPTFWQAYFDLSIEVAGALTAVFAVLASVIRVPGGMIADRIGGVRTVMMSLVTVLAGAVLMVVGTGFIVAMVGTLLMAVGMGTNNAGVFKLVPVCAPESVGGTSGWVGGLGAFGGFAVPPLMAIFVQELGESGYAAGFSIIAVLAVISVVLAWFLRKIERRPESQQPEPSGSMVEA